MRACHSDKRRPLVCVVPFPLHIQRSVYDGYIHLTPEQLRFAVEVPQEMPAEPTEIPFEITHETLEFGTRRYANSRRRRLRPFRVTGRLHDAAVSTTRPLTGEVVVEESECPIKVTGVSFTGLRLFNFLANFLLFSPGLLTFFSFSPGLFRSSIFLIYPSFAFFFTFSSLFSFPPTNFDSSFAIWSMFFQVFRVYRLFSLALIPEFPVSCLLFLLFIPFQAWTARKYGVRLMVQNIPILDIFTLFLQEMDVRQLHLPCPRANMTLGSVVIR